MCTDTSGDILRLADIQQELRETLDIGSANAGTDVGKESFLVTVHAESVAPQMPKIYLPSVPSDERKTAIEGLSRSLDVLEEAASGPMLAGSRLSVADATIFPAIALCAQTLPEHFGWTEWTNEALFWKRPRLHAWWELMSYERACKAAEQQIVARLQDIDFSSIAIDVPTSQIRSFPKHAM